MQLGLMQLGLMQLLHYLMLVFVGAALPFRFLLLSLLLLHDVAETVSVRSSCSKPAAQLADLHLLSSDEVAQHLDNDELALRG